MNVLIMDQQLIVRISAFFGIFLIIALWEALAPRRTPRTSKTARWFNNLSLTMLNSLAGRLLFFLPLAGLALNAEAQGWGILPRVNVPPLAAGVISILILDFSIYLQHLVFHKVRLLWLIHGLHHTDLDIDVTTGTRFHPLEIILSLVIKMGIIVLVGVPAGAFLIFEVLLNGTSVFNHGNIRIHTTADRFLRLLLVTPDMHRVHHSVIIRERNSNYGFNLPWWDRLFGTYTDQPRDGHEKMVIGLANFRDPARLSLLRLLAWPFAQGRRRGLALLVLVAFLLPLGTFASQAPNAQVLFREDFKTLDNWRPLHFPKIPRHTTYDIETKGSEHYLRTESDASASALVYKENFRVAEYPRARWRWKVDNVYRGADPETKGGDDYPIRIYITFEYDPDRASAWDRIVYGVARGLYGEYPPHSTLAYVWASSGGQATILASPYTDKARMIALRKGAEKAGTWQEERVDILADYRKAFGADPPAVASIAIMNDSDDSGQKAVSYIDFIEVYRD